MRLDILLALAGLGFGFYKYNENNQVQTSPKTRNDLKELVSDDNARAAGLKEIARQAADKSGQSIEVEGINVAAEEEEESGSQIGTVDQLRQNGQLI